MNPTERVIDILSRDPTLVLCLRAVRGLALPDCWIGAGFVRNAVWDELSGRVHDARAHDVDVVFFDDSDSDEERMLAVERQMEQNLASTLPGLEWSVTNQARAAAFNGDSPYLSTADALVHWPETATAVAARIDAEEVIHLLAPFGLDDLFARVVRPTPTFRTKPLVWSKRLKDKGWQRRWPEVSIIA